MLPVIIYDPDADVLARLKEGVFAYCRSHESSLSLLADTDSLNDAARYLSGEGGISLMILGLPASQAEERRGTVRLSRQAMNKNRDNYLLYCLRSAADMEPLLNAGLRPMGVLVYPFPPGKLETVLEHVERDYARLRETETGACLVVDSGSSTYRVPYSQILYIEAINKKLTIWTARQSLTTVRMALNNLEETLPSDWFFRCHRSYLVNIRAIDHVDFTAMEVALTSGDALPLARSCRDALKDLLEQERNRNSGT